MSPFISLRFLQGQTDARLLSLAAEGHERAFEALVRRHRRALLAYGRRLLGSSTRAEDAVQQALLQAWMALEQGVDVRDAKSWFYRIVHNTALNMQRGPATREVAPLFEDQTAHGSGDIEGWMEIKDVFTELAALPPLQRQALLRTSFEGESHDEVASALGLTTKAVRGLVYRARATMRGATSALIPPPLVQWALGRGAPGVGASDRIAELVTGGAGLTAIAVNGGAAMVTVGALVAGAGLAPHHQARPVRHAGGRPAAMRAAPTVALAASRAGSTANGFASAGPTGPMGATAGPSRATKLLSSRATQTGGGSPQSGRGPGSGSSSGSGGSGGLGGSGGSGGGPGPGGGGIGGGGRGSGVSGAGGSGGGHGSGGDSGAGASGAGGSGSSSGDGGSSGGSSGGASGGDSGSSGSHDSNPSSSGGGSGSGNSGSGAGSGQSDGSGDSGSGGGPSSDGTQAAVRTPSGGD